MNEEWQNLGNNIKDMVQDAVNCGDFQKLNQNIRSTIDQAMAAVSGHKENSADETSGSETFGSETKSWRARTVRTEYSDSQGRARKSDESVYGRAVKTDGTMRGGNWQSSRTSTRSWSSSSQNVRNAAGVQSQRSNHRPAVQKISFPVQINHTMAGGIALSICGGVLAGGTAMAVVGLLAALGVWGLSKGVLTGLICILPLFAAGLVLLKMGIGKYSLVKRFKRYAARLRGKTYCELKELADSIGKNTAYVTKDLKKMIARGWFPQGHMDDEETCLITDDATYRQYRQTMEQASRQKSEEEAAKKQAAVMEESRPKLSPEAEETIRQGKVYVKRIRACNDAIPGEEISAKILQMETIISKIFDRVERHPENIPDLRKMMDYYLPTTVKLLEAYQELDGQPVQGENITTSKKEIEDTLDTLNEAFERLFDSMFQETAWDVSTDISVLKTLLAQEGLSGGQIDKKQM